MSSHGPRTTPKGENKVAVALASYLAMREHRKDKPKVFSDNRWPARWSDPTYLGDGPWGP